VRAGCVTLRVHPSTPYAGPALHAPTTQELARRHPASESVRLAMDDNGSSRRRRFIPLKPLILALLLALSATPAAGGLSRLARADNACADSSAPSLHTCGSVIVDSAGTVVRLRAVNWYGFDSSDFVFGGLRYARYQDIVAHIKALGFNSLRVPFSNEMVERNPIVSRIGPICLHLSCLPNSGADALAANPSLDDMHALDIMKTIVDYAGSQGLSVILDSHRAESGWGAQENGLWYTAASCPSSAPPATCFTPQNWLDDWAAVEHLFAGDPAVVGLDLHNEPHSAHQPSTCAEYLTYAHWGPCGGLNNATTDWARAASQEGAAAEAIDPRWLIFVEGVSTYPQSDGSFPNDGYGENFQGVLTDPINLPVGSRLIYAPHDYRFFQPNGSLTQMYSSWDRTFGFASVPGQSYTAPIWVGEFGTCTHDNTCFNDAVNGNNSGYWFNAFTTYMDNGDPAAGIPGGMNWSYWPINGTFSDSWSYQGPSSTQTWKSCYGQREDFGLLGSDWSTTAAPYIKNFLFASSPTPVPPATSTPPPVPALATATSTQTTTAILTATVVPITTSLAATAFPTTAASVAPTTPVTVTATITPTRAPSGTATPTYAPSGTALATATASPILPVVAGSTTPTAAPSSVANPATTTILPIGLPARTGARASFTTDVTTTATITPTTIATMTPTAAAMATPTATTTTTPTVATATATTLPTSTSTASPTATATATGTPTATATATPPPVTHWSSFACAPYSVTATPQPTKSPTPAPPTTPITLTPTATPAPKRPAKKPVAAPTPTPYVAVHGLTAQGAISLDILVSGAATGTSPARDSHGVLSGHFYYGDTRRQMPHLALRLRVLQAATTSCGTQRHALLSAQLRDTKTLKLYDAALRVDIAPHGQAWMHLSLGKSYKASSLLSLIGTATIACPVQTAHRTIEKAVSAPLALEPPDHSPAFHPTESLLLHTLAFERP